MFPILLCIVCYWEKHWIQNFPFYFKLSWCFAANLPSPRPSHPSIPPQPLGVISKVIQSNLSITCSYLPPTPILVINNLRKQLIKYNSNCFMFDDCCWYQQTYWDTFCRNLVLLFSQDYNDQLFYLLFKVTKRGLK